MLKENEVIQKIEEKCKKHDYIFLGFYNSSMVKETWNGIYTYLKIKCNKCGNEWFVTYNNFINADNNCNQCKKTNHSLFAKTYSKTKLDANEILKRIEKICMENNLTLISEINKNTLTIKTEIEMKCNVCGYKWKTNYVKLYLKNRFCKKCSNKKRAEKKTLKNEDVINELKKIHPQYDYSETNYVHHSIPLTIICPKHGKFEALYHNLIKGYGCDKCGRERTIESNSYTLDEVKKMLNDVKNDLDTFDFSTYTRMNKPIVVYCAKHGKYTITPRNYINGHRCKKCKSSKQENEIRAFLTEKSIEFEEQKKFEWLGLQTLDFYIPSKNIAIECQGIQHFKPINFGKNKNGYAEERFKYTLELDSKKRQLCEENGIKLLYYSNLHIDYPYKVYENKNEILKEILE